MNNIVIKETNKDFYYMEFEIYVDDVLAGETTLVMTYVDAGRFDGIEYNEYGKSLEMDDEIAEAFFDYLYNFADVNRLEMRSREFKEMPYGFFPREKEETPRGTIYIYYKDLAGYGTF